MDSIYPTICTLVAEALKDDRDDHKTAAIQRYGQTLQMIGTLFFESHLKSLFDEREKG